jgi:hypothetical protein
MAIKWDKFTVKSQEALQVAQGLAAENGNPEVLPLHLMSALLQDKEGVVIPVLDKIGVTVPQLLASVDAAISRLPKVQGSASQPGLSNALTKVLEGGFKEAETFKDDYVSTEHLLLSLARQKSDPVQLALAAQGADHDAILKALQAVRGTQRVTDQNPEGKFQALEKYAKDLTDQSSAAMRRFVASSKCSHVAPKITPCSLANPAWARQPSSKALHVGSSRATCRRSCATSASSRSILVPCSRVQSSAASLKTASRPC